MDNIYSAYHYACKTKADREACKEYAEEAKKYSVDIFNVLYPVGSIYISTTETCPLAGLGVGTWELVASNMTVATSEPVKLTKNDGSSTTNWDFSGNNNNNYLKAYFEGSLIGTNSNHLSVDLSNIAVNIFRRIA